MDIRKHYLHVVQTSPTLSEERRKFLIEHADEIPEEVQRDISTAIAVLERRLIAALDEYSTQPSVETQRPSLEV